MTEIFYYDLFGNDKAKLFSFTVDAASMTEADTTAAGKVDVTAYPNASYPITLYRQVSGPGAAPFLIKQYDAAGADTDAATGEGQGPISTGQDMTAGIDIVTPIKNLKTDPEMTITDAGGTWNFTDKNSKVYLAPGTTQPAKDPGKVRVTNKGKRFLTYNVRKVTKKITGNVYETVDTQKVNPGLSTEVSAVSESPADVAADLTNGPIHYQLSDFKWHTTDPSPASAGGKTALSWDLARANHFVKSNAWWMAIIAAGGIAGTIAAVVYARRKSRKAPAAAAAAPVVVQTPPPVVAPAAAPSAAPGGM